MTFGALSSAFVYANSLTQTGLVTGPPPPCEAVHAMAGCVYDCAHPLWKSDGTCSTNNEGEAICGCNPGYASKDILGSPSCVPTLVLWSFFLACAVFGAAMSIFLAWHVTKYFDIPASCRQTRKIALRLHILTASSIETGGIAALFTVVLFHGGDDMAGGEANLWDFYIIQGVFIFIVPLIVYTYPLMVEYWLLGLPSQFLRSDRLAAKAQELARFHNIFSRIGILLAAVMSAFGAITFSGSRLALVTAEVILMVISELTGIIMGVIGFDILAVINLSEGSVHDKNDAFYRRAKRRVWSQVLGCWSIVTINAIAVIMLYFTPIGRRTPIIPMGIHFCCGISINCPYAHLTAFAAAGNGGNLMATSAARHQFSTAPRAVKSTMATVKQEQKVADQQNSIHRFDVKKTATTSKVAATTPGPTLPAVMKQRSKVLPVIDEPLVVVVSGASRGLPLPQNPSK